VDVPVIVTATLPPLVMLIAPVDVTVPVFAESVWAVFVVVEIAAPPGTNCAKADAESRIAATTTLETRIGRMKSFLVAAGLRPALRPTQLGDPRQHLSVPASYAGETTVL
jgi:hypothetical protein